MNRGLAMFAAVALLELACILQGAAPLVDADAAPEPPGPVVSSGTPTQQVSPELMQVRVSALEARPLFMPGRVPYHPEPPRPPEPAPPPRLTGLVVMQGVRRAIFAAPDGQKPTAVAEGGRLGLFTVTAITASEVQLTGPAGVYTLHPSSDAGLRLRFALNDRIVPLIDPIRREAETESDQ